MKYLKLILVGILSLAGITLFAQGVGVEIPTIDSVQTAIYAGVIYVAGLLSYRYPGINNISDTYYRVGAVAIAMGLLGLITGVVPIKESLSLILAFFASNGGAVALEKFGIKTPKPLL